jgi:hypothetical protein
VYAWRVSPLSSKDRTCWNPFGLCVLPLIPFFVGNAVSVLAKFYFSVTGKRMSFDRWGKKITRKKRIIKGWSLKEDERTRRLAVELGKLSRVAVTEAELGDLWEKLGSKPYLVMQINEWLKRTRNKVGIFWMPKEGSL